MPYVARLERLVSPNTGLAFLALVSLAKLIYLVLEFRYHFSLLDMLGMADPGKERSESLEHQGRHLASLGCALVFIALVWSQCHSAVARRARAIGAYAGMLIFGAVIYWTAFQAQGWLIDWFLSSADNERRRDATLLVSMRSAILDDTLVHPEITDPHQLYGRLALAEIVLLLEADPAIIERLRAVAMQVAYRTVAKNYAEGDALDDAFKAYEKLHEPWNGVSKARNELIEAEADLMANMDLQHAQILRDIDAKRWRRSRESFINDRFVRERMGTDADMIPRPWDLRRESLLDHQRRKLRNEAFDRAAESLRAAINDDFPRISLFTKREDFFSIPSFQRWVKDKLEIETSDDVPMGLGREQFFKQVWRPHVDRVVEKETRPYLKLDPEDYATGEGREQGEDAMRLLYILPFATALSALFAVLNSFILLRNLFLLGLGSLAAMPSITDGATAAIGKVLRTAAAIVAGVMLGASIFAATSLPGPPLRQTFDAFLQGRFSAGLLAYRLVREPTLRVAPWVCRAGFALQGNANHTVCQ